MEGAQAVAVHRQRIAASESGKELRCGHLVPDGVVQYATKYGLSYKRLRSASATSVAAGGVWQSTGKENDSER